MPSSDPDIDAVLGSFDHPEASRDSDAASVLASFDQPKKTAPVPISATDLFGDMAKSVIGGIVHGAGTLADVATGTAPGPGSHAERWASPFAITDRLGQLDPDQQKIHQAVSNAYDKMAGTGPAATEIKTRIPQALEAIGTVVPLIKGAGALVDYARAPKSPAAGFSAEGELPESEESMGAARAAAPITQASPELQQAIRETPIWWRG